MIKIKIKEERGRFIVFTSVNGNAWLAVGPTFPTREGARLVVDAIARAAHDQLVEIQ